MAGSAFPAANRQPLPPVMGTHLTEPSGHKKAALDARLESYSASQAIDFGHLVATSGLAPLIILGLF